MIRHVSHSCMELRSPEDFIDEAVASGGNCLVHCMVGSLGHESILRHGMVRYAAVCVVSQHGVVWLCFVRCGMATITGV